MQNETPQLPPTNPHHGPGSTAETLGIHPLNATILVALDVMLFGGEMASGFLLTVLSVLVSFALVLPTMLVQRYAYKDGWILAFAKSLLLALLMAIPTAIPSAITAALGVTGAIALRSRARSANVVDIQQ